MQLLHPAGSTCSVDDAAPPLQAVVLVIERSSANSLELIVSLLSHLYQAGIVTKDQMQQVGGWDVSKCSEIL